MKSILSTPLIKESAYDFREYYWGVAKEEILGLESAEIKSEGPGFVTYKDTFMEMRALVCYQFSDDYLVEAGYAFYESFPEERNYIQSYEKLKGVLSSTLGVPSIDENILESYKMDCEADTKMAIDGDTMMYLAEWRSERTIVRLILMGSPGNCEFGLLYMSNDYVQEIARNESSVIESYNFQ